MDLRALCRIKIRLTNICRTMKKVFTIIILANLLSISQLNAQSEVSKITDEDINATVSGMAFVTKDLKASIKFYEDFLGFKERKRIQIDTPGGLANFGVTGQKSLTYVALVPATFSKENIIMGINLIEIPEAAETQLKQMGARAPIASELMVAFSVKNLKKIEKMMQANNIPIVAPLTPSATGKSMTLAVLDPNGVRIQMYEYIKK